MHILNIKITAHPNHTHVVWGDFKINIAILGKKNVHGTTPKKKMILGREYTPII